MQGRHQTGAVSTATRWLGLGARVLVRDSERGAVRRSSVGPNTAVTLTPSAAARCSAPESFATSARQFTRTPASVGHIGLADQIDRTGRGRASARATSAAVPRSAAAPTITVAHAVLGEPGGEIRERRWRPALRRSVRGAWRQRDERRPPVPARVRAAPSRRPREAPAAASSTRRRRAVRKAQRARRAAGSSRSDARRRRARRRRASAASPRQSVRVAPALGHAARASPSAPSETNSAAAARVSQPASGDGPRPVSTTTSSTSRASVKSGATEGARRDGDRRAGRARAHIGDRRQRHHRIAQPVGRDDHEAFHSGLIVSMKIALLQINPTVGDLAGNAQLIADAAAAAQRGGAELAVTPELALAGYLPRDLLLSPGFVNRCWTTLAALAATLADGPAVLVGLPEPNRVRRRTPAVQHRRAAARRARSASVSARALLPTYDVFDEDRYFEPFRGPQVLDDRRPPARHQHLRRRLERSRLLEAPALSLRPDSGAGRRRAPMRSSTSRRRRSRSASLTCATRCSAAWPPSTSGRCST